MELLHNLWHERTWLVVGGSGLAGTLAFVLFRRSKRKQSTRSSYPRDTVILHQLSRGPNVPSHSPMVIKLETYLRFAKIPYMNVHDFGKPSKMPKGKWPWIEYNDEVLGDSNFIIDYLNKKFDIDLSSHLGNEEGAICRAFHKMLEENTYWALILHRWVYDQEMKAAKQLAWFGFPWFFRWRVRQIFKNQSFGQGMGRHSVEEVYGIMDSDLRALSNFLGTKKYLMGSRPCEADCAVFGMVAEFYWQWIDKNWEQQFKVKYPNLAAYCEMMKDDFWPDWDECTTRGGTRKATK